MLKNSFALILLIVIVIFTVSCSSEVNKLAEFVSNNDKLDYFGLDIVIVQPSESDNFLCYDPTHIACEKLKERVNGIEEKYNLNISIISTADDVVTHERLVSSMASNTFLSDIVYMNGGSNAVSSAAYDGTLYPLDEFPDYIDFRNEEKYGPKNLLEVALYESVPYAVIPMMLPDKRTTGCVSNIFAINEDLVKANQLTDPRDVFEQGNWTTAYLEEITPNYFINGQTPVYTFAAHKRAFTRSILTCNGLKNIVYKEGEYKSGYTTEEALNIITWGSEYMKKYSTNILLNEEWNSALSLVAGDCFMALCEPIFVQGTVAKNLDNFGLVPFPTGPDTEIDDYHTVLIAIETVSIAANSRYPEASAHVISELLEPIEGYETDEELVNYLFKSMFFDIRDAELFLNYSKSGYYNYWTAGGEEIQSYIAENIDLKAPSEIVESIQNMGKTVIEDYIAPNADFMGYNK